MRMTKQAKDRRQVEMVTDSRLPQETVEVGQIKVGQTEYTETINPPPLERAVGRLKPRLVDGCHRAQ